MKRLVLILMVATTMLAYAQPSNNDCSGAITIPVNDQLICDVNVEATLSGSTPSGITHNCSNNSIYDIWFEFTATNSRHSISYNIISDNEMYLTFVLFEDNCTTPAEIECINDFGIMEDLVPGTTYKIQVSTSVYSTTQDEDSLFTVCINVPVDVITSDATTYTTEELIEDVLISSDCMAISNISFQGGGSEESAGGIGYFEKNNSLFQFDNGIILSSGNIANAPGPADGPVNSVGSDMSDDEDLEAVVGGDLSGTFNDISWIEFDFVPTIDHISFDFLFASNEYGTYQCAFADAFAFILTDLNTGEVTNLAVIPGTDTTVTVTNIRDSQYNAACPSVNPEYFGAYYLGDITAPINYRGATIPMTAESDVVPGNSYKIKLVIGDYNDNSFDSAVFINGGNFNIGSPEYAAISTDNSTVLCEGESTTISVNLDNSFEFVWYKDGVEITGENSNNIVATEAGEYTLDVVLPDASCSLSYSVNVITGGNATDTDFSISDYLVFEAESDGLYEFNLLQKSQQIIQDLNLQNVVLTYHNSIEDANADINAVEYYYVNFENPETLYVRIENEFSGCYSTGSFQLIILDENYTTPAPEGDESQSFEEGATLADLVIEGENIQWYAEDATSGRSAFSMQEEETPLPLSTPLVHGTTYYATQTIYGIESIDRLAVTASLALNASEFNFIGFNYYPNPVDNTLYIENANTIDSVTIYNLLGQSIINKKVSGIKTQINTSTLNKGVYFVKVLANNSEKTIKILKE